VEIDPEFAMAHRKIAVILQNNGLDPDRADSAAARAYRLRDRLTEREQGLAEAYYFEVVLDDPGRAELAYERVLDRYPDDLTALNNLGVNAFSWGDFDAAAARMEQVRDGPFETQLTWENLGIIYGALDRLEQAHAALDSAEARYGEPQYGRRNQLEALERNWAESHRLSEDWGTLISGNSAAQASRLTQMAVADLARGKWREAMLHFDDAEEIALAAERWNVYLTQPILTRASAHFGMLGDRDGARRILLDAIARVPGQWMTTNFGSTFVAAALVMTGAEAEAEAAMAWYRSQYTDTRGRGFQYADTNYRAIAALAAGEAEESVRQFRTVYERLWPCGSACAGLIEYGLALEAVGRTDAAIEVLENQLGHWVTGAEGAVIPLEPLALDRLGHLYEARGDYAAAAEAYERLLGA